MRLENELLLASAARLYTLGVDLDGAVGTLRSLVNDGLKSGTPELTRAYNNYLELKAQFKSLEAEYLRLRDSMQP